MFRKMFRKLFIPLLVITYLSVWFLMAFFQPEQFSSLEELLIWIVANGGAVILAGYVMAYFLENIAGWHTLPRWLKTIIPIAIAGLIGFFAESVLALELLAYVPPIVKSVVLMLINWLWGQRAYAGIKEGPYAASARG